MKYIVLLCLTVFPKHSHFAQTSPHQVLKFRHLQESALELGFAPAALLLWDEFYSILSHTAGLLEPLIPQHRISTHLVKLGELYKAQSSALENWCIVTASSGECRNLVKFCLLETVLMCALCICYFVICIVCFVFCILYFVFCILYYVFCILYFVFCILHFIFCILYVIRVLIQLPLKWICVHSL